MLFGDVVGAWAPAEEWSVYIKCSCSALWPINMIHTWIHVALRGEHGPGGSLAVALALPGVGASCEGWRESGTVRASTGEAAASVFKLQHLG